MTGQAAPIPRRGQPLLVPLLILLVWGLVRAMTWTPALPGLGTLPMPLIARAALPADLPGHRTRPAASFGIQPLLTSVARPGERSVAASEQHGVAVSHPVSQRLGLDSGAATSDQSPIASARTALHSNASLPLIVAMDAPVMWSGQAAQPTAPASASRWSADAWLLLRAGAERRNSLSTATLGGSQAGLIARRTIGALPVPAAVYVRGSQALSGADETELAAGMSVRPISAPVDLQLEVRATQGRDGIAVRPAAFLTTGFYDAALPLDLHARGYAQAGYVGGDEATPFAQGEAIGEARVVRTGKAEVKLGAGAWGGAQRGVSRLDLGPSLSAHLRSENASIAVQLDYRVRVAGDASPIDGIAVTVSAGF